VKINLIKKVSLLANFLVLQHKFLSQWIETSDLWLKGWPTVFKFKVCKSVHHYTFQINQPTRCNNFSSLLLDVYVQLSMFRASSRPSSKAQQLQWQPLVLSLGRGGGSAVGRGQASRPDHDQQHCHHHAPTVKPVVELLMMGVRTPKTCWAVHKRQVISLRNCCILLVDLFVNYSF